MPDPELYDPSWEEFRSAAANVQTKVAAFKDLEAEKLQAEDALATVMKAHIGAVLPLMGTVTHTERVSGDDEVKAMGLSPYDGPWWHADEAPTGSITMLPAGNYYLCGVYKSGSFRESGPWYAQVAFPGQQDYRRLRIPLDSLHFATIGDIAEADGQRPQLEGEPLAAY